MSDQPSTNGSSSGSMIGIAAIALIAMALLAFGYNSNKGPDVAGTSTPGSQTSQATQPAGGAAPADKSTSTTGAAIREPSEPTKNQPKNPAPDTRDAPTASSSGAGDANGGPAKAPDNAAPKQ